MIFYKNFQNKNLLFKTTEYESLKSLHEKILLYNNYLEKNFIKPKKRKEAGLSAEDKFTTDEDYNINYTNNINYTSAISEKSFLNSAFDEVSEYFNKAKEANNNSKQAQLMPKSKTSTSKNNFYYLNNKRRIISNYSRRVNDGSNHNQTTEHLLIKEKEAFFISNIEDRAFNAILSHNLSEIFKSYMPLAVYFLLKVKLFLKSVR